MEQQQEDKALSRITLDDVRQAVADSDPGKTNASKIREIIGRGSYVTIQRHLETLRAEMLAAAMPGDVPSAPPPPTELVNQMWGAAWLAAQSQILLRVERLAAERDAAKAHVATLEADMESLTVMLDDQQQALDAAGVALSDASNQQVATSTACETKVAQLESAVAQAAQALAEHQSQAAHAEALAAMAQAVLREEIVRLTDQVSELKALLYQRVANNPIITVE